MNVREQLILWAGFCHGKTGAEGKFNDAWQRALDMRDTVDAETKTAAGCVRFYLRHVQIKQQSARARWAWLHQTARLSNRQGGTDPLIERPVFDFIYDQTR